MKRCSGCQETKPHDDFYRNRSRSDGFTQYCKLCADSHVKRTSEKKRPEYLAQKRAWSRQNRPIAREQRLVKVYGIDTEAYDRMFSAQGGCCDICGGTENRALSVDHNHDTGEVRALLCRPCNLLLGNARESADNLRAAIRYLERHNAKLRLVV